MVIAGVRLLEPFWDGKLDRQPIYFEQNCGPPVADTVGVPQFLSSCSNDLRQEAQTVCTHLAALKLRKMSKMLQREWSGLPRVEWSSTLEGSGY